MYFFLDSLEDSDFLCNTDFLSIVINNHSENMAKLQDKYLLLDEDATNFEQNLLKKLIIVVEIACKEEFWLKSGPYRVRLLTGPFLS